MVVFFKHIFECRAILILVKVHKIEATSRHDHDCWLARKTSVRAGKNLVKKKKSSLHLE